MGLSYAESQNQHFEKSRCKIRRLFFVSLHAIKQALCALENKKAETYVSAFYLY